MAEITIDSLRGWVLPEALPYRRNPAVPASFQTETYRKFFDDRTLFYDCTYLDHSQSYLFSAPQFRGLWPVFRKALRVNGKPVRWLWQRQSGRSAQVMVKAPATEISLEIDGQSYPLEFRTSLAHHFDGLNCAVTINKNNDLRWIREWVKYHISAHGLQGVVIFDNNSSAYGCEDIADVLRPIEGLRHAAILSAPYDWGGKVLGPKGFVRYKFLQTALINLVRRGCLSKARAVLNTDIDELVLSQNNLSVFDDAAARRFSYVRIAGQWVFPETADHAPAVQSQHVWRDEPPRRCQSKWCANPRALLSRIGWNVHNVGAQQGRRVPDSTEFSLMHCSTSTTGWKPESKRFDFPESLVKDPALVRQMATHLPAPDRHA